MKNLSPVSDTKSSKVRVEGDGRLPITVIIAAKEEEANIARCISALYPAQRLVVIDSHSKDSTQEMALRAGAEVIQFDFKGGYPKKRQWALENVAIETPWILLLDADEVVPEVLWNEIAMELGSPRTADAYLITKGFHFLGRRFRFGGFSHSAVLLFRKEKAKFERILDEPRDAPDMEIHERLIVDGTVGKLKVPLIHDDRKGLEAYLDRHNRYSTWEARVRHGFLSSGFWGIDTIKPRLFGNVQERRRFIKALLVRIPCEPQIWFIYHYLFRLGVLEGRRGLIASQIRAGYISQARAKLYEMRLRDDCA